jgi:divinyl protochlorophyllide a 8-vinyl-reductase
MSEDAQRSGALIGPNAILQMLPVLDEVLGEAGRARLLARAGVFDLPDGFCMIPEAQAARLHHQLRRDASDRAPRIATCAGLNTADYILAHRIPKLAQTALRFLPAPLAARILSKAIAKHAWTFAGSGAFSVVDPWHFEIAGNPIVRGEQSEASLCHWHAAVFTRLYRRLVTRGAFCIETTCCAQGAPACRFEITRE